MSDPEDHRDLWGKLDELSEKELAGLVEATIDVLQRESNQDDTGVGDLPPKVLARQLQAALSERGIADDLFAQRLSREGELKRPVAILLLKEIAHEPSLVAEIDEAYHKRQKMLAIGIDDALVAGLLLLILKLKRVKISKSGAEVDLEQVSGGALGWLLKLVGS